MNLRTSRSGMVFLVLLLAGMVTTTAQRIPSDKPKLVVGITISGMRYDYLTTYWDKFGEDGFKRMASTGTHLKNARYDQLITESAVGFATIATGSGPDSHGIVADYWYERLSDNVKYCIEDSSVDPLNANDPSSAVSPSQLLSRTLTDELRINSQFKSRVIGVSIDPKAAVITSGHTANAAYWFDPAFGTWTSSTYYMDSLPDWVEEFNNRNYKDIYREKTWEPLLPMDQYTESMLDNNEFEKGLNGQITFPYDLARISGPARERDYSVLMYTPYGNTYTKDFAIQAIVSQELGKREATDWINISFDAARFLSEQYTTWSMEMQDIYLRLDQDIAHNHLYRPAGTTGIRDVHAFEQRVVANLFGRLANGQ